MPIRNEASFIKTSLSAALAQDYPADLREVIVVDGMSDDGTRGIVRELQASNNTLLLIDNPARIVPAAMNLGIQQASGDVIVRVDGHTIIASDYIKECVAALERTNASNVGGRMTAVAEGRFGRAAACATSSRFGVGGARFHYSNSEEWVDTVYLGAWPRDVFSRVGLFDEEQVRNQDDEFNYRLLSQGGKILLSPRIRSRYYNRTTIRSLWRQYFQYGYWKVRVMQKHPRQMRLRQFVPPLFVFVFALTALMASIATVFVWIFLGLMAAYLMGSIVASLLTGEWRSMVLLPVVFATLHFAYGSGFLMGLVKFRNRWNENQNGLFKYLEVKAR